MAHVRKQMITFFVTTKCNLSCAYCYTPRNAKIPKEHTVLDLNFAKKGIDDFFRYNASRHIRFYGMGEPTLEIDLIDKICNYAREQAGDKLIVELQTNGFFPESVREWIDKNVDVLWVSFDGKPEFHDQQRLTVGGGKTSEKVIENISYLLKNENMQIGTRVTLTPVMIKRQKEIVEYCNKINLKYINVLPVFSPVGREADELSIWDPLEFAENFLEAHNYAKELGIWYNTMCMVNFDEPTLYGCRSCLPNPHLTTDGYITCCDFAQLGPDYLPDGLKQLVYGKYYPERDMIIYDEDAIANIRTRNSEILKAGPCSKCEYVYNCAGGCLGQAVNETGDILGICENNCTIVQYLAERMTRNEKLHPVFFS